MLMTTDAHNWAETRYEEIANGWETAPDDAKENLLHELRAMLADPNVRLSHEYRSKADQLIKAMEAELTVPGS
jgi:hypothetical protein